MDLVNIRKKAKKEKEKEGKTQETRPKTEETKEEPLKEISPNPIEEVKPESEKILITESVTEKEKQEERPLPSSVIEPPERIKERIQEIAPEPYVEEEADVEIVSFKLGEETYGVKIDRVREILRPLQITSVPRTPDYLKGVTSLRGEIIPVFDLKKRLGLEGAQEEKKRRILILSVRNEPMGALIDEVKGVIKLHIESIEPPPAIITGIEADFLEGVSRIDDQFIGILNVEEVMKI